MGKLTENFAIWSSGRGEDDKEVVLRYFSSLKAGFEQVYQNLADDPEIPEEVFRRFFEHVLTMRIGTAVEILQSFCFQRTNARSGRARLESEGATLGCLKSQSAVIEAIKRSPIGPALKGGEHLLLSRALLTKVVDKQRKMLEIAPITIPGRTVWGWFKPSHKNDPFNKVPKNQDLVRRLGLHFPPLEPLILWGHTAPGGECPKWPNAFDAAENCLYRPGGKTLPTSPHPTDGNDGLDEVVHSGIIGTDLAVEMVKL